jgi:ribosomal protein L29
MKFQELQNKTQEELQLISNELAARLSTLGFQVASNTLKNNSEIKKARRDRARVLTALAKIKYNSQI